jgi:hypothetical protein
MIYACVARFDVTKNLKKFGFFFELNKASFRTRSYTLGLVKNCIVPPNPFA